MSFLSALVYSVIFGVVVLLPILYDAHEAYRERSELIAKLGEKILQKVNDQPASPPAPGAAANPPAPGAAANPPAPGAAANDFLNNLLASPEGIPGLGRVVMTTGVLTVVAIAMIQLLISATTLAVPSSIPPTSAAYNRTLTYVSQTSSSELEIVKSLVTILGGAVSAMIGFYFGARTSQTQNGGST